MELSGITALDEEGVRIVAFGQEHTASGDALGAETLSQSLRGLLAAAVGIDVEGEIDGALAIAQLLKLTGVQMRAQRAGGVAKARLPQHGIVEQALDENHLRTLLNLLPGIQATLGAGEEPMGDGRSDAAATEVDHASALAAGEDDASVVGIAALWIEQAETLQESARIALSGEMPAQTSTRGVADAQYLDRGGIVQPALFQIEQRLGVAMKLLLIEGGSLLEHSSRIGWRSTMLFEISEALAERQLARQLDKAQEVAALTTTVAVEEIFANVEIEGGTGLWV